MFWLSLIVAGILQAVWQMDRSHVPFSNMMLQLRPAFIVFVGAGITLMVGIWMVLFAQITWYSRSRVTKTPRRIGGIHHKESTAVTVD